MKVNVSIYDKDNEVIYENKYSFIHYIDETDSDINCYFIRRVSADKDLKDYIYTKQKGETDDDIRKRRLEETLDVFRERREIECKEFMKIWRDVEEELRWSSNKAKFTVLNIVYTTPSLHNNFGDFYRQL